MIRQKKKFHTPKWGELVAFQQVILAWHSICRTQLLLGMGESDKQP